VRGGESEVRGGESETRRDAARGGESETRRERDAASGGERCREAARTRRGEWAGATFRAPLPSWGPFFVENLIKDRTRISKRQSNVSQLKSTSRFERCFWLRRKN